jgi:RNA polymerase-binding transcription factor DksA
MADYDAVGRQLHDRLTQLQRRIGAIEGDLRSAHDRDWPERANELQNDEVLEGLDEMSLREVRQIRGALKRIEEGRYGLCAACGQRIGSARLAAVPTAVTCLQCTLQ